MWHPEAFRTGNGMTETLVLIRSKLLQDGEQRDGLGGGFNERQERVAAATVEVDEEGFDDFGRRVKKETAVDDKKAKEEAALKRLQDKYKFLMPGCMDATEALLNQRSDENGKTQKSSIGELHSTSFLSLFIAWSRNNETLS